MDLHIPVDTALDPDFDAPDGTLVAKVVTPRESWIEQGLLALAAGGPDTVRVEVLAKRLGVTKGGFYWHFADRPALLDAMLAAWERESVDDAIVRVDAAEGDARARLRTLFALAASLLDRLPIELAIRDWARRDANVHARVERVDNRRMDYLRRWFGELCSDPIEVEARSLLAFATFVGQSFVAVSHDQMSRHDVLAAGMEFLLA